MYKEFNGTINLLISATENKIDPIYIIKWQKFWDNDND